MRDGKSKSGEPLGRHIAEKSWPNQVIDLSDIDEVKRSSPRLRSLRERGRERRLKSLGTRKRSKGCPKSSRLGRPMRTLWSPHSTSSSGSSMARVSNSLSKNTRPAQEELATITRSIRSSMKSVASPHKPRSISCGQRHIVNRSTRSDHIVRKSPSRPRS